MKPQKTGIYLNDYKEFVELANNKINQEENSSIFAIMYMDITGFQLINEFYGFSEGNRLLKTIANFLLERPETILCVRVYSDNFICLLKVKSKCNIKKMVDQYESDLSEFIKKQRKFHLNCKIQAACGLRLIEEGKNSLVKAIDDANFARKEAKKLRNVNIVWFNEEIKEKVNKMKLIETEVQSALRNEEFCFYMQPKVDIQTGQITGAEALARLVKNDGTVVWQEEIVSSMERNQTITEFDFLIYRKVCKYLHEQIEAGLYVVPVSVNLSRIHFLEDNIEEKIDLVAKKYKIPPHLLEFEITETLLMEEFDSANYVTGKLREFGYKVSIDDFGSGYTGINIWKDLKFDVIKLDKRYVLSDTENTEFDDAIISTVAYFAHKTNTILLCEGVESIEQCVRMKQLGCNLVQGYFFSPPVPTNEFEKIMSQNKGYYVLPWNERDRNTV